MSKPTPEQVIAAYHRLDGNKTAVADELGCHRQTVAKYLKEAGIDKPLHGGRAEYMEPNVLPLPKKGMVARYILTSAQNNTKIHGRFWENLTSYAQFVGARIMVSRFTYNRAAWASKKSQKPGRGPGLEDMADLWYDPRLEPYICDDPEKHGSCQWQLAPTFIWCAELNILPTDSRPLSGLLTYSRQCSAAYPHAKIALESVPRAKGEDPKFCYTTGTVTHRNYIQKKAGLKADFHHAYAALIVEVDHRGGWWARHLNCDSRGAFYDCPAGADGLVQARDGDIYTGMEAEALTAGDVHASEADEQTIKTTWGHGGILDTLRPKYQFLHDVLSFRSQSHHDRAFGRKFEKYVQGVASVEEEAAHTAELLCYADRPWCNTIVVNSNHDRHGERWLDEADYRFDMENAEFYLEAQLERVRAIRRAEEAKETGAAVPPWCFHEWALRRAQAPSKTTFLPRDASFVICNDKSGGIECGWHGDEGPNGSRGSTQSLLNVGRRVNKGHDHTATIRDGVYSAGSCQLSFSYQHGPTSHSLSHIVTYPNGKRAILTLRDGKWRAD